MIKNLKDKVEKISNLPRVSKREVSLILKEVYEQGKTDAIKRAAKARI